MEDTFTGLGADDLIELAEVAGVDSVLAAAEERSFYNESERASFLVPSPVLFEAVIDYEPKSMETAIDLQSAALEIGRCIPKLQLAIRALPSNAGMSERKAALAMLDAGLAAHRELSAWSSRAGEYHTEKAINALYEFDGLVRILKDMSEYGGKLYGATTNDPPRGCEVVQHEFLK